MFPEDQMHLARHRRPASRTLARAALLVALAVASLALTRCRMVGDRTTGVDVAGVMKAKNCLDIWSKNGDLANQDEDILHKAKVKDCNGSASCIAQENARDAAARAAIQAALVECQNNCHQQGGGGVGP